MKLIKKKRAKRDDETFADYFDHKPSRALQAMVDGLRESEKREDFEVQMRTYGEGSLDGSPVCFGCAATATVLETQKWRDVTCVVTACDRAAFAGYGDLWNFEYVMEAARSGLLSRLYRYMGVEARHDADRRWYLIDSSWRSELPAVEKTIAELEALGF